MAYKKQGPMQRYSGLSSETKPSGSTVGIGSTAYEYDKNDTHFTPDNTNWYVKDSKSVIRVRATLTASAAAAYASGDAISNSVSADKATTIDFASVAGHAGGTGRIVWAQMESNANNPSAEPILHFFNTSSPNSAKVDNAACNAPTHPDVSTGAYLGSMAFNNFSVLGVSADSQATPVASTDFPFWFVTASADSGLHAIMQTATAATFTSVEIITTLWVRRS